MALEIASVPRQDESFAAIAVELKLGENSLGQISFAAAILCMIRTDNLYNLNRIAVGCGIESKIARDIILNETRFVGLIAEAHRLFKAMIPHEAKIMQMLDPNGRQP
jgi:hypothetical protein